MFLSYPFGWNVPKLLRLIYENNENSDLFNAVGQETKLRHFFPRRPKNSMAFFSMHHVSS